MSEIKLPELPTVSIASMIECRNGSIGYGDDQMREYARAAIELDRASRPAGEAVAWLHDVVQSDGEQDQALSFSPDSFPLKGVGGFESIKSTPLFLAPQATHNKCDADFVALQIARRFVPYLEPQRRAQLQVAIRDAICKATPPPAVSEDVMEAELDLALQQRDQAYEIIDKLCDRVLGEDRTEWSSAYFFENAVEDVEELMLTLVKSQVLAYPEEYVRELVLACRDLYTSFVDYVEGGEDDEVMAFAKRTLAKFADVK